MINPVYLLDANICIDLLVGRSPLAAQHVERCSQGTLVTSAIVYAEVMIGAQRQNAVAFAQAFFRAVRVMPFDLAAGDTYSLLPFKRGNFDRLIAAHAVALDLTLVTNNECDFADIPGLRIENWTR